MSTKQQIEKNHYHVDKCMSYIKNVKNEQQQIIPNYK